jgi:hypothetical protein
VLLKSLGSDPNKLNNVDEAAADSMRLIMETSKISAPLLQALLRRKRVLVVVDGVSEMPKEAAELPIRPDKGAVNTRFLVVTSRLPTNLLESHVIRPQELTIEVLDRVLDDLIAASVGSRRTSDNLPLSEQRIFANNLRLYSFFHRRRRQALHPRSRATCPPVVPLLITRWPTARCLYSSSSGL